jgi:uncharacterized protein with GYD domain
MPTYISFGRWTAKGAESVKQSPSRLDAGRKAFEKDGVKLQSFFMTTGKFDMVIICDAPNDEAMAKAVLALVSSGNITTQTSRAFTEDEYRKIMGSL